MLFTDNGFHNTGLDSVFDGFNRGRFNVTGEAKDMGLFRTPTLRNCALTAPYMHDGRYQTLDEVIEHYNSGVHKTATIDPIMTLPGKEMGLLLSNTQKQHLKAFLLTLTDTTILSNPQYSRP
jgi:cytochrome c peroxidase